jgi:hypothetical protein
MLADPKTTGRFRPDPEKLITASVLLEGTIFRVLAPVDTVLHSAAHAFQDGDLYRVVFGISST